MHERWPVRLLTAGLLAGLLPLTALMTTSGPLGATPARAADVAETQQMVPAGHEPDGSSVQLDVSVFTPGTPGRHPAIVLAHGFGGTKGDSAASARTFAAEGYLVLTYTARGFGASGGRIHLDAPDYEVADASKLIDLLATRPDVALDAPGDPRVGVAGASYGGALALLAAGHDRRVDAVAAAITWNDLGQALFPQSALAAGAQPATPAGAVPASTAGVFKQRWASLLFGDGARTSTPAGGNASIPGCGRFDPTVCADYQRAAITGTADAKLQALLKASSPATVAGRITAPTLLLQGEQDALFGLDQSDATARQITAAGSTPVRVGWFAGGHDATSAGLGGTDTSLTTAGRSWFDQYLKGEPARGTGFRYSIATSGLGLGASDMTTKQLPAYPGIAGVAPLARTVVALRNRPQQIISPPGGSPAALTGMPGAAPALAALGAAGGAGPLGILQGQSATFASAPLDGGTSIVGSSRVRLSVTSSTTDAVLFASLWVVKGFRQAAAATLPSQLVAPIRLTGLTPGTPVTVDVALPAVVAHVDSGSRLRLVVSSTDQAYSTPTTARVYQVSLDSADLGVPIVTGAATVTKQAGIPWALIGFVLLTIVGAVATAMLVRRRARHQLATAGALVTAPAGAAAAVTSREDDIVLAVNGLVKTYGRGVKAVDGGFWTARRGQVVGLLGPNGAGKTTTMRMIVGLIEPDAGSAEVLGQVITPGSPVLRDVGAYVEGPGFLPHLSGRQNLVAGWDATGRPLAEAHLDEVLDIAGLGSAIDRKVRTYSHGMKARLGIAAAMAGLPAVLILDEPTNGLDPPQIAAMRGVLHDYAATDRTVIVSSHLLAEVEATCTHVVVMARGALVAVGSVAKMLDSGTTIVVTVDRPEDGRVALSRMAGVGVIDLADDGTLVIDRGTRTSAEIVAHLVEAGIGVVAVTRRRALEDVFMSLVST
jgi:ABC-2 type transport system ATP-binding protein